MGPSFIVYIDEAGDASVKAKAPSDASEWFVLSAIVVRADRDNDVVDWVRDMREAVRMQSRHAIHYRKLSQPNKTRVCRMLSNKHVRIFTVASHKTNMRGRINARIGKAMAKDEFYNWCLRLLFERVTAFCAHRETADLLPNRKAKIVFSEQGGHDYHHLKAYLGLLEQQATTGRAAVRLAQEITPGVIVSDWVEVRRHDALAGLQLADIAASAFFQATNRRTDEDLEAALELRQRYAKKKGVIADFGVLRMPFKHQGEIPEECRPIFEAVGYRW